LHDPTIRYTFPMDIHAKLAEMDLKLPTPAKPGAVYVPAVRVGDLVFVSGQVPFVDGKVSLTGPVPSKASIEMAQQAARVCALNGLAVLDHHIGGDWTRFIRLVRLGIFVNSDDTFTEQHIVGNGASQFLVDLLGDAGTHARAAIGVNALPLGSTVEVEMIAQVR